MPTYRVTRHKVGDDFGPPSHLSGDRIWSMAHTHSSGTKYIVVVWMEMEIHQIPSEVERRERAHALAVYRNLKAIAGDHFPLVARMVADKTAEINRGMERGKKEADDDSDSLADDIASAMDRDDVGRSLADDIADSIKSDIGGPADTEEATDADPEEATDPHTDD